MQPIHNFNPYGRSAGDAADIPHRFARKIAGPDANRIKAGGPYTPIVAHVFACARFDGSPEARGQRAFQAEGPAPAFAVAQNIQHNKCGL